MTARPVAMTSPGAKLLWVGHSGRILATSDGAPSCVGKPTREALGVSWSEIVGATARGGQIETTRGPYSVELVQSRPGRLEGATLLATPRAKSSLDLELLLGDDRTTKNAHELAIRFARTDLPLLLAAEPGSAAGLLARAVHERSERRAAPLAELSGAVLADPSSFDDAVRGAHGTIYVDELHLAPIEAQRHLFDELSGGKLADARLVASTTPDLHALVDSSRLLPELFRMLRGATILLPPLREREDLVRLTERMLERLGAGRHRIGKSALEAIERYAWPGNLRELYAALEHALTSCGPGRVIERADLPESVLDASGTSSGGGHSRRSAERAALESALRQSQGNLSHAARKLGVARSTLYRLLDRHGMRP